MQNKYRALVARETDRGVTPAIETLDIQDLPPGELLVRVHYSSLNYKDALSAAGNRGVTRNYPHTPGIDAAGVVAESASDAFKIGTKVVITGYDFGMNTPGGFGEYVRIPEAWALPLPEGLSLEESMMLGTAGLTAGLSVYRLGEFVKPDDGDIVVSGATGGVGSLSISILKKAGYNPVAATGKPDSSEFLKSVGASDIILRSELESGAEKAMLEPRFAGGIDTVGGSYLVNILKSTALMGAVTCCGNAASGDLNMTVYPFILRGISLIGISSQNCPMELRKTVWNRLAGDWRPDLLSDISEVIELEDLPDKIGRMLDGKSVGRVVLKHRN